MTETKAYPRPDFQRTRLNWASLDGPWDFMFDDSDCGLLEHWHLNGIPSKTELHPKQKIQVPYAFQTPASGIDLYEDHEVIWYERIISDIRTPDEKDNSLLLRFGAVDYECSVWVDGQLVGKHRGGHVPFDLDLSYAFVGKTTARLTVRVWDSPTDLAQARGKQYWASVPESIWYTPTSGIWLSVWLESVPAARIGCGSYGTIIRSDDIHRGELHARVAVTGRRHDSTKYSIEVEGSLFGNFVNKATVDLPADKEFANFDLNMKIADLAKLKAPVDLNNCCHNGVALWEPKHPILYDLTLRLYASGTLVDEVKTTTGMRHISWQTGDGTFRLNGKPYFQALVLDQGYWPDTGMTPPSPTALKDDIEMSMKMGFNGCRKHQKVEDPIFNYWADRLGYLVWGEIANAYEFNDDYAQRFDDEWMAAVRRDINHPCVVCWTPVNESWGYTSLKDNVEQRNHIRSLYYKTKTLDPSRPINDNCGWEHVITDFTTYHDYADSPELTKSCSKMEGGILDKKSNRDMFTGPIYSGSTLLDPGAQHKPGAPIICTEFGGVNISPAKDDNKTGTERDWGYTTADNPADLLDRVRKLVMAVVKGGHSCGFVYTQLCDVEQEVNGLYSFDRKAKIPAEKVKEIIDEAQAWYYERVMPKQSVLSNGAA